MFFSGDHRKRKTVDLGGRSKKEVDGKELVKKWRSERDQRLLIRKQKIGLRMMNGFRRIKAVRMEQSMQRQKFLNIYGKNCLNVDRNAFGPDSNFLGQFLYFFHAEENGDIMVLVEICQLVLHFVGDVDKIGDALRIFAGKDYSSKRAFVNYRMKKLAYACICALHHDGNQLNDERLPESNALAIPLLEVLVLLIDLKLPWSCEIVEYLSQNKGFSILREFILSGKDNSQKCIYSEKWLALEHLLTVLLCHIGQKPCFSSDIDIDPEYSYTSQILTIPFLWLVFPNLKKVFARQGMIGFLISFLPKDISDKIPTFARLLGNIFETGGVPSGGPGIPYDVNIDLAAVTTVFLPAQPSLTRSDSRDRESMLSNSIIVEECTNGYDGDTVVALDRKLDQQTMDNRLFLALTKELFEEVSYAKGPYDMKVVAVGAVSAFLYVIFNTFPLERIMFNLAYRSGFIPALWDFMKQFHEGEKFSSLSDGAPDWLLPLAVFCPVYNNMLKILDKEEFYKLEKPLSLEDIRSLVILLKQALWKLLWENPTSSSNSVRSLPFGTSNKRLSVEAIQQQVIKVASELLSQLQDWNNRQEFTSPKNFYVDGVNEDFISQAVKENTRENEILKQAPFLIPFPIRVKIFYSQVAVAKTSNETQIIIRRDQMLVYFYNQMMVLSENELRGKIRVNFNNEHDIQEDGQDMGGLFKELIDKATRGFFAAQLPLDDPSKKSPLDDPSKKSPLDKAILEFFAGQSLLFKETRDHLLYPNPESGVNHERLQLFHFLGTLLAKAMFEGIPVNLPFAAFFLRKFKEKNDHLKDLCSLDPELYHHLIFVKFYEGDISKLGLHFVILDNEYQGGYVELRPDGKELRVTKENVITYIDLVANHRLNFQTRQQQNSPLLRGSQQRTQKDWIDRFDKHKLQAMFEEILIDLPSTTFYWRKFKQQHNYMNELLSFDPEFYKSLMFLKNADDLSALNLNGESEDGESEDGENEDGKNEDGENEEEELLPGISKLRVTKENVIIYNDIKANYRLNCQIRHQSSHFLSGFQQLIKKDWTDMFSEHELQLLISGSPGSLDVDNLQQHTKYAETYHSAHPVIMMFWEVLKGFSKKNKEKFLKFVTSYSRGPVQGFQYLDPKFRIERDGGNSNEDVRDRLPTASTCANLLMLPPYESTDQLESKLLYAINSGAGFYLR